MSKQLEHELDDHLALAIQSLGTHVRSWKRVNGVFRRLRGKGVISVGEFGSADRYGWIRRAGKLPIPFEIELKCGKRKLTEDQENWRDLCFSMGMPWFLCYAGARADLKSAADATAAELTSLEQTYADRG